MVAITSVLRAISHRQHTHRRTATRSVCASTNQTHLILISILNILNILSYVCRVLRILHVLQAIATDISGATTLLNMSVVLALSQSPLLLLDSPAGYPPSPSKFTADQKTALRQVVRGMILLILTLVKTVRSFRGMREEVVGFIRSSLNLSYIILEDIEEEKSANDNNNDNNDNLLAMETLALYESVLALLACKQEELAKELHGFEEVIARKMRDDLMRWSTTKTIAKRICEYVKDRSKDKSKSKNKSTSTIKDKKSMLYCRMVENSILFLHEYGETISREMLQTFGFN